MLFDCVLLCRYNLGKLHTEAHLTEFKQRCIDWEERKLRLPDSSLNTAGRSGAGLGDRLDLPRLHDGSLGAMMGRGWALLAEGEGITRAITEHGGLMEDLMKSGEGGDAGGEVNPDSTTQSLEEVAQIQSEISDLVAGTWNS